jgi:hypothetical protein
MARDRFIRTTAAATEVSKRSLSLVHGYQKYRMALLTSISNLTGISTSSGWAPLRESCSDLGESFGGRSRTDALISSQSNLLELTIRALDLGLDGNNLIVEPASLLCLLGAAETLGSIFVQFLPGEVEVAADVLAGPAHGLHAVGCLLARRHNGLVKGLVERIAADGHVLGAACYAHSDGTVGDGMCDVGNGLETRGAESVDGGGAGRVGESSSEGGRSELVGSLGIGDLDSPALEWSLAALLGAGG